MSDIKIDAIPGIPGSAEAGKSMEDWLKESTPIGLGGVYFGQIDKGPESKEPPHYTMHFIFQDQTGKKFDCCLSGKNFLDFFTKEITRARAMGWCGEA